MDNERSPLEAINSLVDDFYMGFLTERDYCDLAFVTFHDYFAAFRKKYVTERRPWTEDDLTDLEEGYDAWIRGEETEKYGSGDPFFELLEEADIPFEVLEPIPAGMSVPDRLISYIKAGESITCLWQINFACEYDDGMFSDDDPVGNTYELTDAFGHEAVLKVLGVKAVDEYTFSDPRRSVPGKKKDDADPADPGMTEYACTGSVEGYTAGKRKHTGSSSGGPEEANIYVYHSMDCDSNGGLSPITILPGLEDELAMRSYAEWKQYFDWLDNKNYSLRQALKRYKDKKGRR